MKEKVFLHIIAFNVPYPPNYGGIIDIYYKIKTLGEAGVKIILHCFLYERQEAPPLEEICHSVHYYRRKRGLKYFFSPLPYIVISRQSGELETKLLSDPYPVLFEGLHTTLLLDKCIAIGKKAMVRTHNIEHNYYRMLARSERNLARKLHLRLEARKLLHYESVLDKANKLIAISTTDTSYFGDKYGKSVYVSAFHQHDEVESKAGFGDYILFHGNLSVPENEKALVYLVRKVLSKISYRIVIAGKEPGTYVQRLCRRYANIDLISNPGNERMNELVSEAHINLLYTYQPTGLKLKLLHSLYGGRHCMANPLMLSGSELESLCHVYRSPSEAIETIEHLMETAFTAADIEDRQEKLRTYKNSTNARKIIELL